MRELLFKAKDFNKNWIFGDVYRPNTNDPLRLRYDEYYIHSHLTSDLIQVVPETISQFTGLIDKKQNKIFENDLIKHGHFYWQSGSSEDWFGTEPQNSFNVVEAYPEIVESIVTFHNGMFMLKTNWKNPIFKNKIRYPLFHLLNETWNVVDEFEDQEPKYFKMMLEENDCKSSKDIKNILSEFEIIGNIFD